VIRRAEREPECPCGLLPAAHPPNLAPSIVFSRIGQVVPNAMKAPSDWVPRAEDNGEHRHEGQTAGMDRPKCRRRLKVGRCRCRAPECDPQRPRPRRSRSPAPPQTRPRLGRILLVALGVSRQVGGGPGEPEAVHPRHDPPTAGGRNGLRCHGRPRLPRGNTRPPAPASARRCGSSPLPRDITALPGKCPGAPAQAIRRVQRQPRAHRPTAPRPGRPRCWARWLLASADEGADPVAVDAAGSRRRCRC